jgi:hypothetical protein
MHRATMVWGSFALLLNASDALAQELRAEAQAPLAAASRDAQRLADCTKAFDTDCVVGLSDLKSYALLNPPNWNFRKNQARHFDLLKHRGVKYAVYDTYPPQQLFADGGRVYAFVPYVRTVESRDRSSITTWYFIALC